MALLKPSIHPLAIGILFERTSLELVLPIAIVRECKSNHLVMKHRRPSCYTFIDAYKVQRQLPSVHEVFRPSESELRELENSLRRRAPVWRILLAEAYRGCHLVCTESPAVCLLDLPMHIASRSTRHVQIRSLSEHFIWYMHNGTTVPPFPERVFRPLFIRLHQGYYLLYISMPSVWNVEHASCRHPALRRLVCDLRLPRHDDSFLLLSLWKPAEFAPTRRQNQA